LVAGTPEIGLRDHSRSGCRNAVGEAACRSRGGCEAALATEAGCSVSADRDLTVRRETLPYGCPTPENLRPTAEGSPSCPKNQPVPSAISTPVNASKSRSRAINPGASLRRSTVTSRSARPWTSSAAAENQEYVNSPRSYRRWEAPSSCSWVKSAPGTTPHGYGSTSPAPLGSARRLTTLIPRVKPMRGRCHPPPRKGRMILDT